MENLCWTSITLLGNKPSLHNFISHTKKPLLLLFLLLLLLLTPTVYVWLAYILWHGVHHILGGYTHREIERLRQGCAFITELLSWRKYGLTFIQIYPVITTLYSTRFSFSFMFVVVIVVIVVVVFKPHHHLAQTPLKGLNLVFTISAK